MKHYINYLDPKNKSVIGSIAESYDSYEDAKTVVQEYIESDAIAFGYDEKLKIFWKHLKMEDGSLFIENLEIVER